MQKHQQPGQSHPLINKTGEIHLYKPNEATWRLFVGRTDDSILGNVVGASLKMQFNLVHRHAGRFSAVYLQCLTYWSTSSNAVVKLTFQAIRPFWVCNNKVALWFLLCHLGSNKLFPCLICPCQLSFLTGHKVHFSARRTGHMKRQWCWSLWTEKIISPHHTRIC